MVVFLKEWARELGVHPVTAYRWFREGRLLVPARRTGRLILVDLSPKPVVVAQVVACCRVSSADQMDDLERQAGRVVSGGDQSGLGCGSGGVVGPARAPPQAHEADRKSTRLNSSH